MWREGPAPAGIAGRLDERLVGDATRLEAVLFQYLEQNDADVFAALSADELGFISEGPDAVGMVTSSLFVKATGVPVGQMVLHWSDFFRPDEVEL